ncbi:MAG: exo-alpha-sialidase [Bacteroidia bacterium]|nr:exo-alpha-sialidase [Bacteroidia bacterium]
MKIDKLSFLCCIPVISVIFFPFLSCNQAPASPQASRLSDSLKNQKSEKTGTANIVFRSADNGQSWQDISDGLPEPANDEYAYGRNAFFTDDNGLWLADGNGIYHTQPNFTAPFWTKAFFPGVFSNLTPGKNGIFAYNYQDGIFQKTNGTNGWSPVFTDFKEKRVRSVLETAAGTLLIGTDKGLYKSTDNGKNWKLFPSGSLGSKTVESNGVLLTGGSQGIMRSTDYGEHWDWVIREGGVGIDVTNINGGFAAINYSTTAKTRRIRTSYDGGQTWQSIDTGFPGQAIIDSPLLPINAGHTVQNSNDSAWHPQQATPLVIEYKTSIIQVGDNFFCGHTDGIYKTSDKGKTWQLVLPAAKGKMFKLAVSGNVIYAIQMESHC